MSFTRVLLVFGGGPRIGAHLAKTFSSKGYKIALVRRSKGQDDTPDRITIAADLSDASSVGEVFNKVRSAFGSPPSVVVYNAAQTTIVDSKNPFESKMKPEDVAKTLAVGAVSPYTAVQEAIRGWSELPDSASKTYIYTGNIMNHQIIPALMDMGMAKSAAAHMIETAAHVYAEKGWKFYYADERNADGTAVYGELDGEAGAEHYLTLAEGDKQLPWLQTFVKGEGYKQF